MKLELELLGQVLEAEVATVASARTMWGLGLLGAGVWAVTPAGRKALRKAGVKAMAASMAAGDRLRELVRRRHVEGEEAVAHSEAAAAPA